MRKETRAKQIEADAKLVDSGKLKLRDALRRAVLAGACEERGRTLAIIEDKPELKWLYEDICSKGVLEVLGCKPTGGHK